MASVMPPAHDRVFGLKSKRPDVPPFGMRLFLLTYTLFVFLGPVFSRGDSRDWMLAALSIAVFIPMYVAVWVAITSHRDALALVLTMVIALYGFALIPTNIGANTYVVYSAALVPFLVRPGQAIGYLAVLVAGVLLISLVVPVDARVWVIVPTALLIVMIGGANVFYAEHHRRNAIVWRAQEEVTEMATLAERERISRDLHDLLGHTLSVITLKSELASRLADSDPARAAAEIREVERVSRGALSEVRAAVEGYRGRGLSGELQSAARTLESSGVRMEATIADSRLSARQESVFALALREAVTNIVRHARASSCWISLRDEESQLVLSVRDNGVGGAPQFGYGLTGMRERVAAAGGTMTVDGSQGMMITVSLPKTTTSTETRA
jgi:two-component system sensor histidine kinase DesK